MSERYAQGIMRMLKRQPYTYRWFGAWWWPLKAALRGYGYDLGSNDEPQVRADLERRAGGDPARVLRLAMREYQRNAGPHTHGEYQHAGRDYYLDDDDDLISAGLAPFA